MVLALLVLAAIPGYNAVSNFNADLDALLVTYPAYGAYSAAAVFYGTTLTDLSGNGRDARVTAGVVSRQTRSGNGASSVVQGLAGGTSTKIEWPAQSIPPTFTVTLTSNPDT